MQGLMPPYTNRFEVVGAYYIVASRWHSGGASKGYNRLCLAMKRLSGNLDALEQDEEVRRHAAALLRSRKQEIRRHW